MLFRRKHLNESDYCRIRVIQIVVVFYSMCVRVLYLKLLLHQHIRFVAGDFCKVKLATIRIDKIQHQHNRNEWCIQVSDMYICHPFINCGNSAFS